VTSPAHRQYLAIKQRYPDAILLFRMGDFYEMFDEDARIGAAKLQITLTSREFARGDRVPMAGIPHHALQSYLKRFMEHGLKVAICEQLTEPGRGLVERDVVRVVTPGTLIEPALLDAKRNNYLAALHRWKESYGLAYVDVTTGEYAVTEFAGPDAAAAVEAELLRLSPSECLVAEEPAFAVPGHVTLHDEFRFEPDGAREALCRHFGVRSLEGFGCAGLPAAIGAAGAILSYVERANRSLLGMLAGIRTYHVSAYMVLDRYTRKNLELTESARSGGVRGSLLWMLDATHTAMGGRLLRRFISQPLLDVETLERRLSAVDELHRLPILRGQLRSVLARVADLERLTGRVCQGTATPPDLLGLRDTLRLLGEIGALLSDVESGELEDAVSRLDPCADVADLIDRAVHEAGSGKRDRRDVAAASAGEALIKPGFSEELDGMKASIRDSREWIARLEPTEQERTGIKSLKVGYNKVFGYSIEVSNANLGGVPSEYIRKQTLVNGERFITPDLKEHEARILQAEERIGALERRIFTELLGTIARESTRLFMTAGALAHVDVYLALAEVAARHRYVRPELTTDARIEIRGGRHPVVEVTLEDEGFIPNDCILDCDDCQILLITGPNMGGKSTYLRQVALCVLLAQIGSFVPAERACVGLVDRIFTRVGAQDDIAGGQSTFMVEMVETANILHHATRRSLLLLDEIGRGTSTYDGLAIARAVAEHIHERIGARTLFATHYHELTALADRSPRIYNANVAVAEDGNEVVFLHRVVPGGADRSYGIHVARLAGLPPIVTERAEEVLHDLEEKARQNGHRRRRDTSRQLLLFGEPGESLAAKVLDDLLALDVTGLTPIEALTRLNELQQKGRGG
jgi:DNA mismatch repair protein MutS